MRIPISSHFTYGRLLKFIMPTFLMSLVTCVYGMVDGFFVSNFVGKDGFTAVNLILPVVWAIPSAGLLTGSGGSALISYLFGKGEKEKGLQVFTFLTVVTAAAGIVLGIVCILFMEPMSVMLGADENLLPYCMIYGTILSIAVVFCVLQYMYSYLWITAEKGRIGFIVSVIAGVVNIVGDYLLVVVFDYGITGAAVATALSWVTGGIIPLIYFARKNDSLLRFVPFKADWAMLGKTCSNGAAEMLSNLSVSVVAILYNWKLLELYGDNGVAAYGVVLYVTYMFIAFFIGFSSGSMPIAGYNLGAGNYKELRNLFHKGLVIIGISCIVMTGIAEGVTIPVAKIYVGYDQGLFDLTVKAMRLYFLSYLVYGYNSFGAAFFTGLNDGRRAAVISVLRTLALPVAMIYTLPLIWPENGIWMATLVSEALTVVITGILLVKGRTIYGY